jgi:hypothetical protein
MTAANRVSTTATSSTAAELLEAGACSPRCLVALGDGPCGCSCGGRWHGALARADVGDGNPAVRPSVPEESS